MLGAILLVLGLADGAGDAGEEEKSSVPVDFFRCSAQRSGSGGKMTPSNSIGIGLVQEPVNTHYRRVLTSNSCYLPSFERSSAPLHSAL